MTATRANVPALPAQTPSALRERLLSARAEAVDAILKAEELEGQARTTRRSANAKLKHYERLLEEASGQLRLEGDGFS